MSRSIAGSAIAKAKKGEKDVQDASRFLTQLTSEDWKEFWKRHPEVYERYKKWAKDAGITSPRKANYVRGVDHLIFHSPADSNVILPAVVEEAKATLASLVPAAETKEVKEPADAVHFEVYRSALLALLQQIANGSIYLAIKATDPTDEKLLKWVQEAKTNIVPDRILSVTPLVSAEASVRAYGITVPSPLGRLVPMLISRRPMGSQDVRVDILYGGVCHSDLHHIRNDWKDSIYPMVPGHEIIGRVSDVGPEVTEAAVGDIVAVGNMLDSCGECPQCIHGHEQYCANGGPTWTYNSHERFRTIGKKGYRTLYPTGETTYGGYSQSIVANQKFVFRLPEELDPATAAPLLCAGITVFAPLRENKIGKKQVVGIAGIGGLGHLGVMIAKKMGATVIALTTSSSKLGPAVTQLGADDAVYTPDPVDRQRYKDKIDFILNTIPASHNANPYLEMVKADGGKMHVLGDMEKFPELFGRRFVFVGKSITSSNVGGVPTTREMLAFCAKHRISPIVEHIPIENINEALINVERKIPRYRYVIDWSLSAKTPRPTTPKR